METGAAIDSVAEPEISLPLTRPAEASDNRILLALCLGSFVATLTFAAPAPFLSTMADDFGVGVPLLGQLVTAMTILGVPLALVAGPLADHRGHRNLILLGLVAAAACLLNIGLAPTFAILLLSAIAGALAEATVPGLSLGIAGTHFSGPASRRAIGWTVGSLASAAIVGVPIMAVAGDALGWRVAFVGAGIAALVVAWAASHWLPRDTRTPEDRFHLRSLGIAYRPLLRDRSMLNLYGSSVLRATCWIGMLTYFGAFLNEELGLSTGQVGLTYMLGGSGYFLGSMAAGGPLGRISPRPLVAGANIAMAILMCIAFSAAFGTAGSVAVLPLAGFAGAVGWVGLASLLTSETPAGVGATMTLSGALFNLGGASGGALGGLLLYLAGYTALAICLPIFALASAALVWRRQAAPLAP